MIAEIITNASPANISKETALAPLLDNPVIGLELVEAKATELIINNIPRMKSGFIFLFCF